MGRITPKTTNKIYEKANFEQKTVLLLLGWGLLDLPYDFFESVSCIDTFRYL